MNKLTERGMAALIGGAVTLTGAQFVDLQSGVPLAEVEVVCEQLRDGRQIVAEAVAQVGPKKRPPFISAESDYLQPAWLKLCVRPEFERD